MICDMGARVSDGPRYTTVLRMGRQRYESSGSEMNGATRALDAPKNTQGRGWPGNDAARCDNPAMSSAAPHPHAVRQLKQRVIAQ